MHSYLSLPASETVKYSNSIHMESVPRAPEPYECIEVARPVQQENHARIGDAESLDTSEIQMLTLTVWVCQEKPPFIAARIQVMQASQSE